MRKNKKEITDPAALDLVTKQQGDRWPTIGQEEHYHSLNVSTRGGRPQGPRIKPRAMKFQLIEELSPAVIDKLLTASSLSVKGAKRYPGYTIQAVYNLKQRPIQII